MKKLIYILSVLFIFTACGKKKNEPLPNKNDTPTPTVDTNPTSSADYYLVFFDGTKPVKIEQGKDNVYCGAGSSGNSSYSYSEGKFLKSTDLVGSIEYGKNYGFFPSHSEAYNGYTTGTNTFGEENSGTAGFFIYYKDISGTYWYTASGTGIQTGSAINISSKSSYNSLSSYYTIEGTFNCTVYDPNGNSKTLTNGKFKTLFGYN